MKVRTRLEKQLKTPFKKDAEDCIKIYNKLMQINNGDVWCSQWDALVFPFKNESINSIENPDFSRTFYYKPTTAGYVFLRGIKTNVYILLSDWMHNGDTIVNDIRGIYRTLRAAQHSLVEELNFHLKSYPYNNMWGDGNKNILEYDINSLSAMSECDPDFKFDVKKARLWKGNKSYSNECEDYITFTIKEYQII